jgi:hypothetical protein
MLEYEYYDDPADLQFIKLGFIDPFAKANEVDINT